MTPGDKRKAIVAALDNVFSGDGSMDAWWVEQAFAREGLTIVENGEHSDLGQATQEQLDHVAHHTADLIRGVLTQEDAVLVREKWDDKPFLAIPVDAVNDSIDSIWEE